MESMRSGRWGPYRQASPPPARHRPGARSARRGGRRHPIADRIAKETTMWFRTRLISLKSRPPAGGSAARLRVEALEDRCVPAVIADPVGDFLPGHLGSEDAGAGVAG